MAKFLAFEVFETTCHELVNLDTVKAILQMPNISNDPDASTLKIIFKDDTELLVYGDIYELADRLVEPNK